MFAAFETYTHVMVSPQMPTAQSVCLQDIAHSLSHQCCYLGHVKRFYSLAEHAVLLSYAVPLHLAAEALLHEAFAAYVGPHVSQGAEVAVRLLECIGKKYDVRLVPASEPVTYAHAQLAVREYLVLKNEDLPPQMYGVPPLDLKERAVVGYLPSVAKQHFLSRVTQLGLGR